MFGIFELVGCRAIKWNACRRALTETQMDGRIGCVAAMECDGVETLSFVAGPSSGAKGQTRSG